MIVFNNTNYYWADSDVVEYPISNNYYSLVDGKLVFNVNGEAVVVPLIVVHSLTNQIIWKDDRITGASGYLPVMNNGEVELVFITAASPDNDAYNGINLSEVDLIISDPQFKLNRSFRVSTTKLGGASEVLSVNSSLGVKSFNAPFDIVPFIRRVLWN